MPYKDWSEEKKASRLRHIEARKKRLQGMGLCVDCGKPYDLWYRHESGYGESEDENLHAFRQKMERLRRQLAHAREENERVRLEL